MRRTLCFLLTLAAPLGGQPTFLEVTPSDDPNFVTPPTEDFWINAVAPADVDGDGDLDLAVLGFYVVYNQSVEDRLLLLLNEGEATNGEWQLSPVALDLGTVSAGSSDLAWGDFDGDGDHDLAVGSDFRGVLYRNEGGTLSPLPTELPGYAEDSAYTGAYDLRSLTWADYDNDGDLDLLMPSVWDAEGEMWRTELLRNEGDDGAGGWSFVPADAGLDATLHAQSAWADDDGDQDLDLLLVHVEPLTDTGFVRRYRNDGGSFSAEDLLGIRIEYGLADWGDYDQDGDLDLLVAGNIQEEDLSYNTVLRVYRNDGTTYTALTLEDAPSSRWLDLHAATWADYDSDGDADLLATGSRIDDGEIVGVSRIYANEGGVFVAQEQELPAPVSSVGRGGAFTWLDIDGDGDLDYLVAGAYYVLGGNGLVEAQLHMYRNMASGENGAPTAPGQLQAQVSGQEVNLSWQPAVDDHTPMHSLSYELRLQRLDQGRSTAGVAAARRLPEPGGLSAVSSWRLSDLPRGHYQWTLWAVDSAFAGSEPATGVFEVEGPESIFSDDFETGGLTQWLP